MCINISFLGPKGTFTHEAAHMLGKNLIPYCTIPAVMESVSGGECQFGVVPIENSIEGPVGLTLDSLAHKFDLKIFKEIVSNVMKNNFNGIFLVATNPLDVMTYLVQKYSGLPYHKVMGSGTSLDTARLRYLVGEKISVNPKNVHGYVIGEHGDSEFVPWSNANVGLQNIKKFLIYRRMYNQ